jgi:hypothetical protein
MSVWRGLGERRGDWAPNMPQSRDDRLTRWLLACGAIGPPVFVAVFLIEAVVPAIRPVGYSALRHPVSGFAIGEHGWVQTANFLMTGMLLLGFAVGLRAAWRHYRGGIWVSLLFGLIAVGLIGAGVFTADPISGYPPGTPAIPESRTTHGALHDAFSTLFFLGLPAACCLIGYRFARSGHRWWGAYSVGTAAVFVAGFILAAIGFAQDATFVAISGLLQRLTVIAGLAWITLLAAHLIRQSPKNL